ncbi:MAG: LemA family protein [archaeon]|jgi:LemA protein
MDLKWIGIGAIGLVLVIVVILIALMFGAYNGMVVKDNAVKSSWSEVENQYQRQADLIPNLTSILGSSVSVETKFVKDVTEARTKWLNAGTQLDREAAGYEMNQSMATFVSAIATTEAYPTLQANGNFTMLMDEVAGTQNRITVARGRYIEAVQSYNVTIQQIPNNFFAGMLGYTEKEYYKASVPLTTPALGDGKLPQ